MQDRSSSGKLQLLLVQNAINVLHESPLSKQTVCSDEGRLLTVTVFHHLIIVYNLYFLDLIKNELFWFVILNHMDIILYYFLILLVL